MINGGTRAPNGRAVLGGLLVAVSVVGIFAAHRSATAADPDEYVVAARDLVSGTVIGADDLRTEPVDLPPSLADRVATDPAALIGDVTVAPLATGDLIQASSVTEAGTAERLPELSFAVPTDRAVNGLLTPGELVDILATFGTGESAWTELVAEGATVVAIDDRSNGAIVADATTVLTLALPTGADVLAVTHAVRAGDVTVVRPSPASDVPDASDVLEPTAYWPRRPAGADPGSG